MVLLRKVSESGVDLDKMRRGFQKVSESGVDSDKMGDAPSKSVRIRCGFGQNEKGTFKKCQNQVWIWTKWVVLLRKVSESGVDLDKMGGAPSKNVRIRCGFGQNGWWSFEKCPNQVWIRTK